MSTNLFLACLNCGHREADHVTLTGYCNAPGCNCDWFDDGTYDDEGYPPGPDDDEGDDDVA